MPTIAQELQTLDEVLSTVRSYNDAPELYKRRCQLYESVCAVKTWDDGSQHKRIVKAWELSGLIGQGQTDWVLNQMGHPDLFREEELPLSWTDVFEWPFVKVTLTGRFDREDCFKYNAQRMEAS